MKIRIIFLIILVYASSHAEMMSLEFASSFGSPYWITDSNWHGSVGDNGLYYKEYAIRGEYSFTNILGASIAFGWLNDRYLSSGLIVPAVIGYSSPTREIYYLLPSFSLNSSELRLHLGAVIKLNNDGFKYGDYPFDEDHKLAPSFGIELGEKKCHLVGSFLSEFPIIAVAIELGLGMRFSDFYEQRVVIFRGNYDWVGFGYKGEYRIYKQNALIFGIAAGGDTRKRNLYNFTIGLKTILGHRSLSDNSYKIPD